MTQVNYQALFGCTQNLNKSVQTDIRYLFQGSGNFMGSATLVIVKELGVDKFPVFKVWMR